MYSTNIYTEQKKVWAYDNNRHVALNRQHMTHSKHVILVKPTSKDCSTGGQLKQAALESGARCQTQLVVPG